jgi:hypothetical protein
MFSCPIWRYMPSCHLRHALPRASVQPLIIRSILLICNGCGLSSFQGRMISLLPTVHVSLPAPDPVLLLAAFRIRSVRCLVEASMMQSAICRSHVFRYRPFSSQVSPGQSIQRMSSSPRCKGAHRDPFLRCVIPCRYQVEASHVAMRHFFY